jgi:carbon monoxide dehydrogenase subunit G
MSNRVELPMPVEVDAPAAAVWAYVTDWERQGEWMLGTRVRVTGGDGRGVGTTLHAVTGVGPLGVPDTMEVVEFVEPTDATPGRAAVRHTGRIIRGEGFFEVAPLGPHRCRFTFTELIDLPLGALGRLGWPLARPVVKAGFVASLRRMAARCAAAYKTVDGD